MGTGQGQRGPPEQPDSWCLWSKDIREKVRAQAWHWYLFTSEWVWRWARRLERSAKARLQWEQEKGFSPAERRQRVSKSWTVPGQTKYSQAYTGGGLWASCCAALTATRLLSLQTSSQVGLTETESFLPGKH